MKARLTRWCLGLVLVLSGLRGGMAGAAETYSNPVIPGENLADPTVLLYKGTYYLYPTGGRNRGYDVYTSKDLVNWAKGPQVFDSKRPRTWAPDVFFNPEDQKVYLYYTADFTIGVAVADAPTGPFVDKGVLVEKSVLDAHLFRDEDGKLYLYYTMLDGFHMHVQAMETPLKKKGEAREIFRPTQAWEIKPGRVNEGPWMVKERGKYYLVYSGAGADWPDYAVGYAVARSPLGPFEKHEGNPIVRRGDGVYGPGHGCIVKDAAGKMWHVYHQKVDAERNYRRIICIDPVWFDEQGNLHSQATRGTTQPGPAGQR